MINLIKADFYRIFQGKAIYITLIIVLLMMFASIYEISPGYLGVSIGPSESDTSSILSEEDKKTFYESKSLMDARKVMKKYPYKLDKAIIGVNANLYYFFIVIVVIVMTTDLSNSTAKNTISSSISRGKYYISKLVTCLILCSFLVLINNYGAYLFNILLNGREFSSSIKEVSMLTIYQLPLIYGIISLLVSISACVKKISIFNTITIPLLIVVELGLSGVITMFKLNANIMDYEYQMALQLLALNPTNAYILKTIILGLTYVIVFNLLGYYILSKSEIK